MSPCPRCKAEMPPAAAATACPACGATSTEFLRQHALAPLDGKYQLVSLLGVGGMGEVYKAIHVHLNAPRVIKLMRPTIAGEKEAHERFLREARMATKIQHPSVAALYDFSALPDGAFYMVWEYIEGTNLQRFVRDRRFLRPELAVRLAAQALRGLDAIHRAGIVHRDISPENLMVTRDAHGAERVKIIDLGVAKHWGDSGEGETQSGIFVGKFKYCSPEQLGVLPDGGRIDGRADIYSFGLVLYEMLTGVAPFQAETPHQYLALHSQHMPRPLQKANAEAVVPQRLEAVIFRALAKDRRERFSTAEEFAVALEAAVPQDSSKAAEDAAPATVVQNLGPPSETPMPRPTFTGSVVRSQSTGSTRLGETVTGRKRELLDQITAAIAEEQYVRADAALQTLRMHLGARAESDGEFRRVRKELETAAADREAAYFRALDSARREAKPREIQRLLTERNERLGRRFADNALTLEVEMWLRRRGELLAKARTTLASESFRQAGEVLDELAMHLEDGAEVDEELLALRQSFEHAIVEASEKMGREIAAAQLRENILITRRMLAAYDARFGGHVRKPSTVDAAEAWIRQVDELRATSTSRLETTTVRRRIRRRRRGWIAAAILTPLVLLAGAVGAAFYWKERTAELVRRHASGSVQAQVLGILSIPQPPAPEKGPPRLDPAGRLVEGQIWRNPIDQADYVWIPPGSAELGCMEKDEGCAPDELPRRTQQIGGFWLGRTEVTLAAFERFAQATGHRVAKDRPRTVVDATVSIDGAPSSPDQPAAWLTAADAAAYCAWVGGTLPSEEQWEYAARARSSKTVHSWGDDPLPASPVANLADEEFAKTFSVSRRRQRDLHGGYSDGFDAWSAVGSFGPNRLGLVDLEGNVWEWCRGSVLRGGSFASTRKHTRISARLAVPDGAASFTTGCRCVLR